MFRSTADMSSESLRALARAPAAVRSAMFDPGGQGHGAKHPSSLRRFTIVYFSSLSLLAVARLAFFCPGSYGRSAWAPLLYPLQFFHHCLQGFSDYLYCPLDMLLAMLRLIRLHCTRLFRLFA